MRPSEMKAKWEKKGWEIDLGRYNYGRTLGAMLFKKADAIDFPVFKAEVSIMLPKHEERAWEVIDKMLEDALDVYENSPP